MADGPSSFKGHRFGPITSKSGSSLHAGDINGDVKTRYYYEEQRGNRFFKTEPGKRQQYLHEFARTGEMTRLQELLKLNVDLETGDGSGNGALHIALKNGQIDCAKLLIENAANPNALDGASRTPLMIVLDELGQLNLPTQLQRYNDLRDFARLLLSNGARESINEADSRGMTALLIVSQSRLCEIACILLDCGAKADNSNKEGCTALMYAASRGDIELARRLLSTNRVDPRQQVKGEKTPDSQQWTALMKAADYGSVEMMELLMSIGADPSAVNRDGETALMIAAKSGRHDVVHWLTSPTRISSASKGDKEGRTALMWAVIGDHYSVIPRLAKTSPESVAQTDHMGRTALMWAAQRGFLRTAKWLAESYPQTLAITDNEGQKVDEIAFKYGNKKVGEMLQEKIKESNAPSVPLKEHKSHFGWLHGRKKNKSG